jgi:poly-gamma-glutamate capsule biosynthesis protein CapA/YwtB (metallophosphatase superfamily)
MSHIHRWGLVAVVGFLSSCSLVPSYDGCTPLDKLPVHTLLFTGDLMLGRRINEALHDTKKRERMLSDVADTMRAPDITLVNGEGVISGGGTFTDKGEPRPYMYRADPVATEVLKQIGVDVITLGNNHSGDYGPFALQEMLDRLQHEGIQYTGAGTNLADARQPAYVRVDDTVIAIVGVDLTISRRARAKANTPGVLWLPGLKPQRSNHVIRELKTIQKEARQFAHVVVLTPHWGNNFSDTPSAETQALGKRIIREAGYDAIFGHSAHQLQGAELIDGKPIIYDAGNLLLDFNGHRSNVGQALLFEVQFTRAGITEVSGTPILMKRNKTIFPTGTSKEKILSRWQGQSASLNTEVTIENGKTVLRCDPGKIRAPTTTMAPPERTASTEIRLAPPEIIVDQLPTEVDLAQVTWPGGVEMIGSTVFPGNHLPTPKAGVFVDLYFRTTKPLLATNYTVLLKTIDEKGRVNRHDHLPGDWLLPSTRWPVDKIIHDRSLFRLTYKKPHGEVVFLAALSADGEKPIQPLSSSREVLEGFIVLGRRTYRKGTPILFRNWALGTDGAK